MQKQGYWNRTRIRTKPRPGPGQDSAKTRTRPEVVFNHQKQGYRQEFNSQDQGQCPGQKLEDQKGFNAFMPPHELSQKQGYPPDQDQGQDQDQYAFVAPPPAPQLAQAHNSHSDQKGF